MNITDTTLTFKATTDVPVTRPEILEEQTGRREIKRITFFRGELRPAETVSGKSASESEDAGPPTVIVTALWTSIAEADLEDLSGFEETIGNIQESFEVF